MIIKENPDIIEEGKQEFLGAIKEMALIKIATSVRRANLLAAKQDHGESFREFFTNVRANVIAAALTCDFTVKCPN